MLPPRHETVREMSGTWWVAHTRSRFEKAFAWDLDRHGIGYFLPMVERVRVSGGRKRKVLAPLFAGYVFFCGDVDDRYVALTTNRLCQTLGVSDQETLVEELAGIELALAGKAELDPYPYAAVGRRCRIRSGPFQGLEGTVVQRGRTSRLVLQVTVLGQGVVLEIDADLLEPAD